MLIPWRVYVFFYLPMETSLALEQRSLPGKTSATRCHPPGPELLTIVGRVGTVYPPPIITVTTEVLVFGIPQTKNGKNTRN